MKYIQIGKTRIVLAHVTHFDFTPLDRVEFPAPENPQPGTTRVISEDKPACLEIYIGGDKVLRFFDKEAESGNRLLAEYFA
jgi:hypothetical protein